mmetsp:Transcript_33654/g.24323  ORF Transcript_33654/g.24323 Transcript_33654/m.24323 type:complete len:121 (-) Transcript_33654:83-445(-)|eukprot:CAMPEP_0116875172 /NCGR_PEP_ID=MMETSP0463-20121206/6960_1 /TAXON_ID=181622 /ORGANISM="Strombidinopsis sp, Strain SopsisLIS2011" /LENGTH=120 /DNA_ID=CAMNT_0004520203 /DNA_START=12 /DNA_END=374 /DNA_ORIENTATION=+
MEFSNHNQGVTSVKVHHRPGGNSSIQLGGGYGEEDLQNKRNNAKPTVKGANEGQGDNKIEEEKKEETTQQQQEQKEEEKPAAGQAKNSADANANTNENKNVTTSVQVRAPPGGHSQISFG